MQWQKAESLLVQICPLLVGSKHPIEHVLIQYASKPYMPLFSYFVTNELKAFSHLLFHAGVGVLIMPTLVFIYA